MSKKQKAHSELDNIFLANSSGQYRNPLTGFTDDVGTLPHCHPDSRTGRRRKQRDIDKQQKKMSKKMKSEKDFEQLETEFQAQLVKVRVLSHQLEKAQVVAETLRSRLNAARQSKKRTLGGSTND